MRVRVDDRLDRLVGDPAKRLEHGFGGLAGLHRIDHDHAVGADQQDGIGNAIADGDMHAFGHLDHPALELSAMRHQRLGRGNGRSRRRGGLVAAAQA